MQAINSSYSIFKKIVAISVSVSLIFSVGLADAIDANTSENCVLVSSQPYGYTGDITGKRIYTKEKYTYECTTTTTKIDGCAKWDDEQVDYNVSNLKNDIFFQSEEFDGGIGEALAISQAYDKINGIWSGWHGLCQDGVDDGNWDWTSDPYVIGGMVLSGVAGGMGMYSDGLQTSANAMQASVRAAKAAQEAAKVARYAVCAARAGMDVASMIEDYQDDGEPCDPVDEICGGDGEADDNGNIFTIPEDEYYDLLSVNPGLEDSVNILEGVGTGVLTLKVFNNVVDTEGMSSEESEAAAAEAKEMTMKINAAMTTLQLASCVAAASSGSSAGDTGSGSSASNSSGTGSLLSAKSLALMALGAINPLLGLAASLLSNMYDSISSHIDTCNNETDAEEKGSRHLATYNSVPLGLCHFIEKVDSGDAATATLQSRYRYCCYDDKTTRIMVEQVKAQFAKTWEHCTDVTITELQEVSFSACDPAELDANINGVLLPPTATQAERNQAYQFTHHCIDTREYLETLLDMYGGGDMYIDTSDAERIMEEMR